MSTMPVLRRRSASLFLLFVLLVASSCVGGTASGGSGQGPAFSSAATPPPQETPSPTPTRVPPQSIRLAGGARGSAYDGYAKAVAEVWMARVPGLKVTVLNTDGPADNLRLLDAGAADAALTRDDLAELAANKLAPFGGEGSHPIRAAALAALYQESVQIIVAADSNIRNTRDLVGRRVSTPPADSAAYITLWQVLRAGNFRAADFGQITGMTDANAAVAYRDKRIDVILTTAAGPVPAIQEAVKQRPARLISLSDDYRDLVQQRDGTLHDTTVPAGSYQGQEGPAETVGALGILVVRRDLPIDAAYTLAKALVEGRDDLAARDPSGPRPHYQ